MGFHRAYAIQYLPTNYLGPGGLEHRYCVSLNSGGRLTNQLVSEWPLGPLVAIFDSVGSE